MTEQIVPRLAERLIAERLQDFRVVMVEGPRQAGKTTLGRQFANRGMKYVSLDDPDVRDDYDYSRKDFVAGLGERAIIDEVQVRPEILRHIKLEVDERPTRGRFLITGSSSIVALKQIDDVLTGRACRLKLLPLCQAEVANTGYNGILEYLLSERTDEAFQPAKQPDCDALSARGGYPEFVNLAHASKRESWLRHYCRNIVDKDIPHIAQIKADIEMRDVLKELAFRVGSKLSLDSLGRALTVSHPTARKLVSIMEKLGIISLLGNYDPTRNLDVRQRRPKLQFTDSGMLAVLLGLDESSASKVPTVAGRLLECFVFSEIAKLCHAQDAGHEISFWSDNKAEVDIVLRHQMRVVGIEVKRSKNVRRSEFAGLIRFAQRCSKMKRGVIMHAGTQFDQFRHSVDGRAVIMQAMPAAWLWAPPADGAKTPAS